MSTTCEASSKTRFFVIDDNKFGFVTARQPNQMSVLGSRASAMRLPLDGPYPILHGVTALRPATMADFDTFRVSSKGYDTDPACEMPAL